MCNCHPFSILEEGKMIVFVFHHLPFLKASLNICFQFFIYIVISSQQPRFLAK